jgi:hypothetical protein
MAQTRVERQTLANKRKAHKRATLNVIENARAVIDAIDDYNAKNGTTLVKGPLWRLAVSLGKLDSISCDKNTDTALKKLTTRSGPASISVDAPLARECDGQQYASPQPAQRSS